MIQWEAWVISVGRALSCSKPGGERVRRALVTHTPSSYCPSRVTRVTCVCCGESALQIDQVLHAAFTTFQPVKSWCNSLIIDVGNTWIKGTVCRLGKYVHLLSCREFDETIDTVVMSVWCIWSYSQQPVSLLDRRKGEAWIRFATIMTKRFH